MQKGNILRFGELPMWVVIIFTTREKWPFKVDFKIQKKKKNIEFNAKKINWYNNNYWE